MGFGVWGSGFRVQGFGLWVNPQSSTFSVYAPRAPALVNVVFLDTLFVSLSLSLCLALTLSSSLSLSLYLSCSDFSVRTSRPSARQRRPPRRCLRSKVDWPHAINCRATCQIGSHNTTKCRKNERTSRPSARRHRLPRRCLRAAPGASCLHGG